MNNKKETEKEVSLDEIIALTGNLWPDLFRLCNEDSDFILEWFYKPNDGFQGQSPYELCLKGDLKPLEAMIYRLDSGEPSS
jgi:hypothetical protein